MSAEILPPSAWLAGLREELLKLEEAHERMEAARHSATLEQAMAVDEAQLHLREAISLVAAGLAAAEEAQRLTERLPHDPGSVTY